VTASVPSEQLAGRRWCTRGARSWLNHRMQVVHTGRAGQQRGKVVGATVSCDRDGYSGGLSLSPIAECCEEMNPTEKAPLVDPMGGPYMS